MKMRRCEDEKMRYRPPLLEEPCAQTLSGTKRRTGLDDGWPESVEEQGLLLLVWRHHITKQFIKDVL